MSKGNDALKLRRSRSGIGRKRPLGGRSLGAAQWQDSGKGVGPLHADLCTEINVRVSGFRRICLHEGTSPTNRLKAM